MTLKDELKAETLAFYEQSETVNDCYTEIVEKLHTAASEGKASLRLDISEYNLSAMELEKLLDKFTDSDNKLQITVNYAHQLELTWL